MSSRLGATLECLEQGLQGLRTRAHVSALNPSVSACICEVGIIKSWEAVMVEDGGAGRVLPVPDMGQGLRSGGQRPLEPPEDPQELLGGAQTFSH